MLRYPNSQVIKQWSAYTIDIIRILVNKNDMTIYIKYIG